MTSYTPLNPEPWKPVQFITAVYPRGGGIETDGEAGNHRLSDIGSVIAHLIRLNARGFVIYSLFEGSKLVDATTGSLWAVFYWNGRVSKYVCINKITVYPVPTGISEVGSCWPFFDWLKEIGVAPGSATGMAQKLWRRSLTNKVSFYDEGRNGRLALYGSRKEAIRGRYHNVRYQDLSAAFPTAMSETSYPRTIRETRGSGISDCGYALATVRIPSGLTFYPIPTRLGKRTVTYGYGTATDWWMHEDLRHVLSIGGSVAIHRNYRGFDLRPVFHSWWHSLMRPARDSLSGDALLFSKSIANRLWSSFAVGGANKVIRWKEDSNRKVIERNSSLRGMRYESYIAAQTTALVRSRVWEALNTFRDPIYVDTDGIICREMEDAGNGWRIKRRMRLVEIHSCSNYWYQCYRCGTFSEPYCGPDGHYSLAVPTRSIRAAKILLKSPEIPVNPLFGITVQPTAPLESLRAEYAYQEPEHGDAKEWLWTAQTEGDQKALPV